MPRALIVTALPLEHAAVCAHVRVQRTETDSQGTYYSIGEFEGRAGPWEVAVIQIRQGNVGSALLTGLAVQHVRPDVCLLVGIGGGLKDDLKLGDVVAATKVYGYERGKDTRRGLLPRPDVFTSAYRLVQAAMHVERQRRWQDQIIGGRGAPAALVDPIAAGEKVVASNRGAVAKFLTQQYSDAAAVEMEGHGFLQAAHVLEASALVVRGISDRLSSKRATDKAGWQPAAAAHAAAFAFEVLSELSLETQGTDRAAAPSPSTEPPIGLPPALDDLFRKIAASDPAVAGKLYEYFSVPQAARAAMLKEIVARPPSWLLDSPAAWEFVGQVADVHELHALASAAYECASQAARPMRYRWLARAAVAAAAAGDLDRAGTLISSAMTDGRSDVFVETMAAVIRGDAARVVASTDRVTLDPEEALTLDIQVAIAEWNLGNTSRATQLLDTLAARYADRGTPRLVQAQLLLARAASGKSPDRLRDLGDSVSYALEARDLMHGWGGNAARAIAIASSAAVASDDAQLALRIGLPESLGGEAKAAEAEDPRVLRQTARAALLADLPDVLKALHPMLRGTYSAALMDALRLKRELGGGPAVEAGLTEALDLATDTADIFTALFHLADIGAHLPSDRLHGLRQADEELADLVESRVDALSGQFVLAKERLRRWSKKSADAARALGHVHAMAGEVDQAIDQFRDAGQRFGMPTILLDGVDVALRGDRAELAEQVAEEALTRLPSAHPARAYALAQLVQLAAVRQDWREVERRARELRQAGDSEEARWALVRALFNQASFEAALAEVDEVPALRPRTDDDAHLIAVLLAEARPPERAIPELLDIAEGFAGSERVVGLVLQVILMTPAPSQVIDDVKHRFQLISEDFFQRFPNSRVLRRITIASAEDLLALAQNELSPGSKELIELERSVRAGVMPYGLLAYAANRPYATALAARGAGFLVAVGRSTEERERGQQAAVDAVDRVVVVDTSAVLVANLLETGWSDLSSRFHRIFVADTAVMDSINARRETGGRPSAAIVIDHGSGQAIPVPISAEDAEQLAQSVVRMADVILTLDQAACPTLSLFSEVSDSPRPAAWLSSIQVAHDRHLPLWSDDAAHRALATEHGVSAFGTLDFVGALVRLGRLPDDALSTWTDAMLRARVGDVPLEVEAALEMGRASAWAPGPLSAALARSAIWLDHLRAHAFFMQVFQEVGDSQAELLPHWLQVAATGAALRLPSSAHLLVGVLLSMAIAARRFDGAALPELLAAARLVCADVGAPDPLPTAVQRMLETATGMLGAGEGASLVVGTFSRLPEEDRTVVRKIVFPPR